MSPPPISAAQLLQRLRPWAHFFDFATFSLPISLSDATYRINQNLSYFFPNYALIVLFVLFLSLLYHPIYLIFFLVIFAAWVYLYFSRSSDDPLLVLNYEIGDRILLGFLSLVTLVALFWTSVWLNVVVAVVIGGAIVCFHAALRAPEDVEGSPYGSLLSDVTSPQGDYIRV